MNNELTIQKKQHYTIRATSCLKRMAQDIIELSQIAHEYHQEFGYQDYIQWVKDDLKLGTTYGKQLLNVFEQFGTQCVLTENFAPSALRLLSAPSTPESAREEAQELAEAGESVTHAKAKELVEAHKELEELKAKLAANEAQLKRSSDTNGMLLRTLNESTSSKPQNYPLISNIQELLDKGQIMPAKAKALQTLTAEGQTVWFAEYVAKFSLENQLEEERRAAQKANEKALKAIEEKEAAIAKLSEVTGNPATAEIIAKHELQLKQMREEYQMKLHEERKQIAQEASEFQAKMHREKIEKAEKEKSLAEKREKEMKDKASAAWRKNDELIRENKKLQSQLEVDKPSNIDNARALKLESELKHLDWTFPDIKAEAELAGGEMHETKKIIIEIINRWSSLLQELDGQEIIEINQ